MQENIIVGVDMGGTDLKNGKTHTNGDPFENLSMAKLNKRPSMVLDGPGRAIQQIVNIVNEYRNEHAGIAIVGLSTAGPADRDGVIEKSTNYGDAWNDFPVRKQVEDTIGIQTIYENDGNAAAIAEYDQLIKLHKALINAPGIAYTVGTGLGAGIIGAGGEIQRGHTGKAGELGHIGHLPTKRFGNVTGVEEKGITCGCNKTGHAEQFTNLDFIERELVFALEQDRSHELASLAEEDSRAAAKQVLSLASRSQPDELCLEIMLNQARNLGSVISEGVTFIEPGWVVIGGGVTEASPALKQKYLSEVKRIVSQDHPRFLDNGYLDYALLGDHAGWYGAALSASKQLNR